MENPRHDDGNQHRIDKQDGGRNARIHVVIALEEKERGKREQQPHYRQRKYIRLLQRKGLFLHFHQDAQHHNGEKVTVKEDGVHTHSRPVQGQCKQRVHAVTGSGNGSVSKSFKTIIGHDSISF